MGDRMLNLELERIIYVLQHPSNNVFNLMKHEENLLYLTVKGKPNIGILIHIPPVYPNNGTLVYMYYQSCRIGDSFHLRFSLTSTIVILFKIFTQQLCMAMPLLVRRLNPGLYVRLQLHFYDFPVLQ
nr:hypothetical transcript [Hymenolepis microstoma]